MSILVEDSRQQLIAKSKASEKGQQRYKRRTKSKVANTVKSMNSIDMNKLFKQDILTVNIPVHGETDDYVVRITFGGFLEILRDQLDPEVELNFRDVSRAAIIGFNREDVYINCSCFDFKFRYGYHATRNDINSGTPETRPSNITNPDDTLGSACKHVLLVLSNTSWIIRVARVITNYIKYMKAHYPRLYTDVIYPAIYGVEYEEPVQLTFNDTEETNELDSSEETIDSANTERRDATKFQKGNNKGVRFAKATPEEDEEDSEQLQFSETDNDDDVM